MGKASHPASQPASSFHTVFCVKGTPSSWEQDGLNHVQPNLRPPCSQRKHKRNSVPACTNPSGELIESGSQQEILERTEEDKGPQAWARVLLQGYSGPGKKSGHEGLVACGIRVSGSPDFPVGRLAHSPLSRQSRTGKLRSRFQITSCPSMKGCHSPYSSQRTLLGDY